MKLSWNSIRVRLSVLLAIIFGGIGLIVAGLALYALILAVEGNVQHFAEHEVEELSKFVARRNSVTELLQEKWVLDTVYPEEDVIALQIWSVDGKLASELKSDESTIPPWSEGLRLARAGEFAYEAFTLDGHAAGRAAKLVKNQAGAGWIVVSIVNRESFEETLYAQVNYFIYGIIGVILSAFICSWLLVTAALAPVAQLVKDARVIRDKGPELRLSPPPGGSELSELTQLLNSMLQRMDESFVRLRRFTAHVGHELRTPLARMRGEAEYALTHDDPETVVETLSSMLEDVSELSQVIDALLELALEDKKLRSIEPLDMPTQITEISEEYELILSNEPKSMETDLTAESAVVLGDRALLSRAFWNVLINAMKYSPANSAIQIRTGIFSDCFTFSVCNDTEEALPESLEPLFEPFVRGNLDGRAGPKGYGLGLALTRSIVRRHSGTLTANRVNDRRICVQLSLPIASAADIEST